MFWFVVPHLSKLYNFVLVTSKWYFREHTRILFCMVLVLTKTFVHTKWFGIQTTGSEKIFSCLYPPCSRGFIIYNREYTHTVIRSPGKLVEIGHLEYCINIYICQDHVCIFFVCYNYFWCKFPYFLSLKV